MSAIASTSTSHSKFVSIFNAALETYRRKTKKDLASHPLLPGLQTCDSPEAILTVLREQIPAFGQSHGDNGLTKWVAPTVNVFFFFFFWIRICIPQRVQLGTVAVTCVTT